MKRMIQGLAVVAVAVGAFAFTPKVQNYCLFEKTSSTTCPLLARPVSYTIQTGTGIRFVEDEDINGNCASSTDVSNCTQKITYSTN